jgi:hypothetical protein
LRSAASGWAGLVSVSVAIAIWLSDRWVWVLPALIGVMAGTAFVNSGKPPRSFWGPVELPATLGSLLIVISFLDLSVVFLILQVGRLLELGALGEPAGPVPGLVMAGTVALVLLVLGAGAVVLAGLRVPQWMKTVWRRLLEER